MCPTTMHGIRFRSLRSFPLQPLIAEQSPGSFPLPGQPNQRGVPHRSELVGFLIRATHSAVGSKRSLSRTPGTLAALSFILLSLIDSGVTAADPQRFVFE